MYNLVFTLVCNVLLGERCTILCLLYCVMSCWGKDVQSCVYSGV